MSKQIIKQSLINALATFAYTALIAWFVFNFIPDKLSNKADNFAAPLFVLMLLIISATVTGFFVLGKPIQLYFENKKQAALIMLFATIGWLMIFALIIMAILAK